VPFQGYAAGCITISLNGDATGEIAFGKALMPAARMYLYQRL